MTAAVPVGTKVSYGCDPGWVFSHNWYQMPKITITCQSDGTFDGSDDWPLCVDREYLYFS